ncbi:MAG: hypothetical protein AVDCRST_MAG34-2352 [uncultured Nocardioidaceae bacterium]|uniref:Uncharacterized protein n=1 Tax=uncultured Nocardioidaceae bacterium TaxID=253824 RepID=A0A6J4MH85_9ACTN|nr:MAG: hypothetical protein AVDCRST_MAG34-2352 [uncultured Nocardioidaceae bacterium]
MNPRYRRMVATGVLALLIGIVILTAALRG